MVLCSCCGRDLLFLRKCCFCKSILCERCNDFIFCENIDNFDDVKLEDLEGFHRQSIEEDFRDAIIYTLKKFNDKKYH